MFNSESNAQEVIERLFSAYGVTTQRTLTEALNVPSNNVSAWSQRNSVPGSAIIKCVLDTGVDLQSLVNGELASIALLTMQKAKMQKSKTSLFHM
ncbi:helix-turn-helix domain-containing protein [Pantoea septica]|uniref:helix-turn-helix domain-containing protein n=1 Tax=Pantoea septica TaxID=472695 RepID=UPI001FCBDDE2|nr:helix-turn-helix domain-containing protein [Pantoea septica]